MNQYNTSQRRGRAHEGCKLQGASPGGKENSEAQSNANTTALARASRPCTFPTTGKVGQDFGYLTQRVDSLEKTLMLGGLRAGEGDDRG